MSAVRRRPFLVTATFGLLLLAALRADVSSAATTVSPDPAPVSKGSPAPDPYPAQAAAEHAQEPVTQAPPEVTYTPPEVTQTPVSTSTGSTTTSPESRSSVSRAPTQKTTTRTSAQPQKKPQKTARTDAVAKPAATPRPRRSQAVALAATSDGRPLLFGGLGLAALALASGGLLFLVNRAGRLEGWS